MRSRRNIRNPARLRLETALSLQADLSLVSSMREKRTKRHPTAQKAPSRGTVASTLTVLSSLLARARLESDWERAAACLTGNKCRHTISCKLRLTFHSLDQDCAFCLFSKCQCQVACHFNRGDVGVRETSDSTSVAACSRHEVRVIASFTSCIRASAGLMYFQK